MSIGAPQDQLTPEATARAEGSPAPIPPAAPEAWRPRDLVLFLVVFAFLLLLVSPILTSVVYMVLQPLMGWRAPTPTLVDNAFFLLAVQTVFYMLLLGYVYLLVVVHYRKPFWAALSWRKPSTRQATLFFLGGLLLCLFVQLAPPILPDVEDFPMRRLFSSPQAAYAIAAYSILVAPLMEELVFRGVFFRFFETQAGVKTAVLGTAALFAAMHVPQYWGAWNHVLLIAVVALGFSLARGLTGSLAPSVFLHIAYNVGLMIAFFFETRQFQALGSLVTR